MSYESIIKEIDLNPDLSRIGLLEELFPDAPLAQTFPEGIYGNIYIRPMLFGEIGSKIGGHKHNFDHVTMLWRGTVIMRATLPDGKKIAKTYEAVDGPLFITIKAEVEHEFTALVPNSLAFCIYAHRDIDGEVVPRFNGWMEAYS